MTWTRGDLQRNWAMTPLGMTSIGGWTRGHLFRGGAQSWQPASPVPMKDLTNPKTWTRPTILT